MGEDARIVLYRDRLAYIGATTDGKSTLARLHFEAARCRRVLVDPKHQWRVADVQPVYDVSQVDWRAPVIHVRPPNWLDREWSDSFYNALLRRLRHALVWTDEGYGVSSPNWPVSGIAAVNTQGAQVQIGHQTCVQRPVNVSRTTFTEATHLFLFRDIDDEDLKTVRQGMRFAPIEELRRRLDALPEYGFLWVDKRARRLQSADPLPEHLRVPRLVFPA